MFNGLKNLFKKKDGKKDATSKDTAKERLHLVLMQDRANVSADFLDMMRKEIIEVIKKYIDVDEKDIDVRLTNKPNEDGTLGAPALYANIPIAGVKDDFKTADVPADDKEKNKEDASTNNKKEEVKEKVDNKKEKVKSDNQEKIDKKETEKLSNEEKVEVSDEKDEKESKVEEVKKKEEAKKEEVKKEEKKKEPEKKENNSSK